MLTKGLRMQQYNTSDITQGINQLLIDDGMILNQKHQTRATRSRSADEETV